MEETNGTGEWIYEITKKSQKQTISRQNKPTNKKKTKIPLSNLNQQKTKNLFNDELFLMF